MNNTTTTITEEPLHVAGDNADEVVDKAVEEFKFQLHGERVLVIEKEEGEETAAGGKIIVQRERSIKPGFAEGTIVEVGDGTYNPATGQITMTRLQEGDQVLYNPMVAHKFPFQGFEFKMISWNDVVATIDHVDLKAE